MTIKVCKGMAFGVILIVLLVVGTVDILLRATGDAPIMKKKNWRVDSYRTIGWISEFIKRYIKVEGNESLVGVFTFVINSPLID